MGKGVFYLFIWRLPAFAAPKGGVGSVPCGIPPYRVVRRSGPFILKLGEWIFFFLSFPHFPSSPCPPFLTLPFPPHHSLSFPPSPDLIISPSQLSLPLFPPLLALPLASLSPHLHTLYFPFSHLLLLFWLSPSSPLPFPLFQLYCFPFTSLPSVSFLPLSLLVSSPHLLPLLSQLGKLRLSQKYGSREIHASLRWPRKKDISTSAPAGRMLNFYQCESYKRMTVEKLWAL